jgi:hypothetical protein
MKTLWTSAAFLAAALAAPAGASSDGALGPTSNGTFSVTATIGPAVTDDVQVYGLNDFAFAGNEGDTINNQEQPFCIIRTPGGGQVTLTISSFTNAGAGFYVRTPGGANEIQMLVSIYDQGDAVYYPLTESLGMTLQVTDACTDSGADPAVQLLSISLLNTNNAVAGNYSNSFLVTVAPQ